MPIVNKTKWITAVSLTSALLSMLFLIFAQADSDDVQVRWSPVFASESGPAERFESAIIAGLVKDTSHRDARIIVPVSTGALIALEGNTGKKLWRLDIPRTESQQVELVATPVVIRSKMVVVYQIVEHGRRISHRMAVIDLSAQDWDAQFPILELTARKSTADGKSTVQFNPETAYSHAALKHAPKPGSAWGVVYVGFGNAGDTQPFHGWLFEIDLDAWAKRNGNPVISAVLLTTPEIDCPVSMEYGTQEMICGGGIWSPAGPAVNRTDDGLEIIVPTGNGQVDLARGDYANSLLRVRPGLRFDPGCDERSCRNFNPSRPDEACLSSCKNLFMPRLPEKAAPLRPANHECDDKSFAECLAWMDYDLGGSAPVKTTLANGKEVLIQAGKDGAVYLIDAGHLGIQYDRLQIAGPCGTETDPCKAGWMGMIVTHPAVIAQGNTRIVIVPTFVPDRSHPAGVVALKIDHRAGTPRFETLWRFPDPHSPEALTRFRSHPSFPAITDADKPVKAIVWVVDIGDPGTLYGLRIKNGTVAVELPLQGTGRPLSRPVIMGDTIYLASGDAKTGKSFVEAYRLDR